MTDTIQCSHCNAQIPYDEAKRVVCIKCGADFGMTLKSPIAFIIKPDLPPMHMSRVQSSIAAIERLLELAN